MSQKTIITHIRFVNFHSAGTETNKGIYHYTFQGSNDTDAIDHTEFADGSTWHDIQTGLVAAEHSASDIADWQIQDITNHTAYSFYSIKITDNHGNASYMGMRQIRFYTGGADADTSGETDEDNPRHTFDYIFDTNIDINDAEKLIGQSFNGRFIQSQGKIKPVWEGALEPDGSGGLQTKAIKFNFDTSTNVLKGSFSWWPLEKPNVFIVDYIDSSREWRKDQIILKDDEDINERGEITYQETCYYITVNAIAKRRCKRNYNKYRYRDYGCMLTALPYAQHCEIYDRVTVTDDEAGWTVKDFLIVNKDEDQYGRTVYTLEAYLSGVYDDGGFEYQDSYVTHAVANPNKMIPAHPTTEVTVSFVNGGASDIYAVAPLSVVYTVPSANTYSHTEIWVSTDDTNYYYAGQDSDGSFTVDGMGRLWDHGDTVYVKLVNVTVTGVKTPMPTTNQGSASTASLVQKRAGWYFGQYDIWGGNPALANAATTIVLGGLDGTPKLALGPSADSLTLANVTTMPGFYADGTGSFRHGGPTAYGVFDVGAGTYTFHGVVISSDSSLEVSGTTANTFTINSDLTDANVQLILGRTTGGNATFQWNGSVVSLDKTLSLSNDILINRDSVAFYRNVKHYSTSGNPDTGTLKIVLPKLWSSTMLRIRIEGYNFAGSSRGSSWQVIVGGYNYASSTVWLTYYAQINGSAPFSSVRLASDGVNNVILLGTTTSTWYYPKIVIAEVLAGYSNYSDWDTGWSMSFITDESSIVNSVTPIIDMIRDNSGNTGFGITSSISAKTHIVSTTEQLRLGYDTTNYASFTVGSSGNLTIAPTGDLILNPTGNDIYPTTNYDLNLGTITNKFLTVHAAELWVETLVAASVMATIGGRIVVAPTTELVEIAAAADTHIHVKHNNLASGDRLLLQGYDSSGVAAVEWIAITSSASGSPGNYSYNVTRNLDGSGANKWPAGTAVANTGTTGDGFIDLYSESSVMSDVGPAIVGWIRNSSTYNDITEGWAIGNLNGLYGYSSDIYGAAFGKYSVSSYLTIEPTNGIRFFDADDLVQAQLTSATWTLGYVAGGEYVQIDSTGIEIYGNAVKNFEVTSAGVAYIGDQSNEHIKLSGSGMQVYDGATLRATFAAVCTLYDNAGADRLVLSTNGVYIGDQTEGEYIHVDSTGLEIWGNATKNFEVTSAGIVYVGYVAGGEYVQIDSDGVEIYGGGTKVIDISNVGVGSLNLLAGSDINLFNSAIDEATLTFSSINYSLQMYCPANTDNFYIKPLNNNMDAYFGQHDAYWQQAFFFAIDTYVYGYTSSTKYSVLAARSSISNPDVYMIAHYDSDDYAKIDLTGGDNTSSIVFTLDHRGTSRYLAYNAYGFYPGDHKSQELGYPTTNAWDEAYADNWNNEADIPFLDDRDDLAYLMAVKGSGIIDPQTKLEIVDDNTLPEFILSKNKDCSGKTVIDKDNKPYYALSSMDGWLMGIIKQLNIKYENHLNEFHKK